MVIFSKKNALAYESIHYILKKNIIKNSYYN